MFCWTIIIIYNIISISDAGNRYRHLILLTHQYQITTTSNVKLYNNPYILIFVHLEWYLQTFFLNIFLSGRFQFLNSYYVQVRIFIYKKKQFTNAKRQVEILKIQGGERLLQILFRFTLKQEISGFMTRWFQLWLWRLFWHVENSKLPMHDDCIGNLAKV